MTKGRIIILSGPSGSGKTTLYKKLLTSKRFKGKLVHSLSVTTRPKREGERHGHDYLFVTKKEFLSHRRQGYFLEWQKVFCDYYGTPKKAAQEALRQGKQVLLCIDVKGARVVWKKCPAALRIFIKTPSFQVLKDRLKKRATEKAKDVKHRLEIARKELKEAKEYAYILVNDDLKTCYKKLENILAQELFPSAGKKEVEGKRA